MKCLECKNDLIQTQGKRERQFCNSTCRSNFWQKAKRKVAENNKPENKKKINEARNQPKEKTTDHKNPLTFEEMMQEAEKQVNSKNK